jgi:cytochrome c oxidase subunit 3
MSDSSERWRHHVGHHFDNAEQEFSANKFGFWLFLATEILLFGGLFVAYAVYRSNHPEIFVYAHQFLDKTWGGINTIVLICSSLTMAWGVRAAQLGQQRRLVALLSLTILGGFGFMGIKYVEYKSKWEHGLLPGTRFTFTEHAVSRPAAQAGLTQSPAEAGAPARVPTPTLPQGGTPPVAAAQPSGAGLEIEPSLIPPAAPGPPGLAPEVVRVQAHDGVPDKVWIFFGIYFLMTGLHALHVLAGMTAIGWVLRKSLQGAFGPHYFTPVDLVGLYWHLVDLIWIFLFPLLYLIH